MRHKHLSHPLRALACAALTFTVTQAAELGDITPRSYIGQPLAADIELTSLTPEEVNGLQVRLAIPDVYRGANVTMNPALSTVRMAVLRSGQKQYLHVTTTRAVDADYVHLYVELGVPGKQDVRLATIWLQHDPNPPPPAPVAPPPAPAVPLATQMTSAQAAQIAAQAKADRAAKAAGAAGAAGAGTASPAASAAAATRAAAEPAAVAAARERNKPAPLPSPVETETGRAGSSKASTAQALAAVVPEGPPRRIAGVLVSPSGKPIKPSLKDDSADESVPLNVAQALLPLAPLPLPKGVKRPAPMSCPPGGMTAKECVALDKHNEELSGKITELEGKLKALQGALGGTSAPAARSNNPPAASGSPSTPRGPTASATSAPAASGAPSTPRGPAASMTSAPPSPSATNAGAAVAQGSATAVARADAAGAHGAAPATAARADGARGAATTPAARGDAVGARGAVPPTTARADADGARGAAVASAGAANGPTQSAAKGGATGRQASGTTTGGADGAAGGKPDPHAAKDTVASASMSAKGDVEMRAAQARAGGASASDQAAASAAASEAASPPSVPTKKIRVLPKLKYKKEKPAEQSTDYTLPLAAGGIGLLALLGAGYIYLRKKNAGKGPLKIWQGFRKRKEPVLDDAPPAQDAAASMAEQ